MEFPWIVCPSCKHKQEWTGGQECISCHQPISNWSVVTQVAEWGKKQEGKLSSAA